MNIGETRAGRPFHQSVQVNEVSNHLWLRGLVGRRRLHRRDGYGVLECVLTFYTGTATGAHVTEDITADTTAGGGAVRAESPSEHAAARREYQVHAGDNLENERS